MRSCILLSVFLGCFAVGFRFHEQPVQEVLPVQQNESNIGFEWAFGALVGKERTMVPIMRDTVLKSG